MENIRLLQEGDYEQVSALLSQLTANVKPLDIAELLSDKAVTCLVIELEGKIAGCASLISYYLPTVGKVGKIEDVVISEEYRGQGLGRKIMEKLIVIAKEKNLLKLQLTSSPRREAARALYGSLGFEMKDTNVFVLDL